MKVTPETYQRMGEQLKRIKQMKQGEWMRWATNFWKDGYMTGYKEAKEDCEHHGVIVPDNVEAQVLDPAELLDILLSVKGIGEKRAHMVMARLTGEEHRDRTEAG